MALANWNQEAQALWQQNKHQDAIAKAVDALNVAPEPKPVSIILQVAYYLYVVQDYHGARDILLFGQDYHASNVELLDTLALCFLKLKQYEKARDVLQRALALAPDRDNLHDCMAQVCYHLELFAQAKQAGETSLASKHARTARVPEGWRLPDQCPQEYANAGQKQHVIAFSLWGDRPRYLRGALDNMLAMPSLYPGWTARFYVDKTVPTDLVAALASLGADIWHEAPEQSTRHKLTWRFKVANDPDVGRFLVRDVDSRISLREKAAVEQWLASNRWFHVMRDWWTHTDLMLAGMWGGVAGVLPDLQAMVLAYQPGAMETANVDQWFLRDQVWAYVQTSCFVHDRFFDSYQAHKWPDRSPKGQFHVGINEFSVFHTAQEKRLLDWLPRLPCLSPKTPARGGQITRASS